MKNACRLLRALFYFVFIFFYATGSIFAQVTINEFLPNPTGEEKTEEWIELYNSSESDVNLDGWSLDDVKDGGSAPFFLNGEIIGAKAFLVLKNDRTGIQLNNSGEEWVRLSKDEIVVDEVSYSEAQEGRSYARIPDGGSEWMWIDLPTPGQTNGVVEPKNTTPSSPGASAATSPLPINTNDVLLSEVMACPTEGKEWAELYNRGSSEYRLENWLFRDAVGNEKVFTQSIHAGSFAVIEFAGSWLNNDGDTLILLTPDYHAVGAMSYTECDKGTSFILEEGKWQQTKKVTKGAGNEFEAVATEENEAQGEGEEEESSTPTPLVIAPLPPVKPTMPLTTGVVAGTSTESGVASWSGIIRMASVSGEAATLSGNTDNEARDGKKPWLPWMLLGGSVLLAGSSAPLLLSQFKTKEWQEDV